jgi:ubiquinone/menaquinone biosynthesis C-methylase UbiE
MTALDLGGSRGDLAIPLARAIGASGHVTAIDPAGSLLAVAATRAGWLGLTNLTFRVAEPHDLPFPDGAFDRVTGWIDPILGAGVGPVLGESWRVLKPGGRLVIAALGAAPARLAEEFRRADFTGIEETRLASVEIASGCRAGGRR